ncbi:MAG: peptidoglycan DD-metalloendopeptidase family protein [Proteobacteria bacterium]|nr:peptidoglycan DD-metalloendopeptidase family protein [Pseudomonadota bacterium]
MARLAPYTLFMLLAAAGMLLAVDPVSASPVAPIPGVETPIVPAALSPDGGLESNGHVQTAKPDERAGPRPFVATITVAKGDTLSALLRAAGSGRRDAEAAIAALSKRFDPRKLRVGQTITVVLEDVDGGPRRLAALSLEIGEAGYLVVERRGGRRFTVERARTPLAPRLEPAPADGSIRSTLRVRKGEILSTVIRRAGAGRGEAAKAAAALARHFNPRRLQVGQELIVVFAAADGAGARALGAVSLKRARNAYVVASVDPRGRFAARKADAPLLTIARPAPVEPVAAAAEAEPEDDARQVIRIAKGDTLTQALLWAGGTRDEARKVSAAIARRFDPRKLQVGQELIVVFDPGGEGRKPGLAAANLALKNGTYVVAARTDTGGFEAAIAPEPLIPAFPVEGAAGQAGESASLALPADGRQITLRIRDGDTLMSALLRAGGKWSEAAAAIDALGRHFDPRRLQPGQEVTMLFDPPGSTATFKLAAVSLALGETAYVVAARGDDGAFTSWPSNEPLAAMIDAALAEAVPAAPMIELAAIPEGAEEKTLTVRKGDTLMAALLRAGSGPRDADAAIRALKAVYDPRSLKAGQTLNVALAPAQDNGRPALHRLTFATEPGRNIETGRIDDGGFAARVVDVPLARLLVHAGGGIDSSLYKAAMRTGVPIAVMMDMIRAFSYDVDFQREIQRGDAFEVLFERYLDDRGVAVREGNVLYAALTLSGDTLKIYRHTARDGYTDFYDERGNSVRKALLRTPIDGARLSSGYGKRRHPILGYTKMHRGVDFAARSGAPIIAAGDGVVVRAGWNGAYGRYIRIRHKGQYSTAYAHLSRLAKNLRRGRRVKQGQVIGYVGSSGRSTGPHLHYEVLRGGRQINPLKVKLPAGARLRGAELAAFRMTRRELERQLAALPLVQRVAEAGQAPPACGAADGAAQPETGC